MNATSFVTYQLSTSTQISTSQYFEVGCLQANGERCSDGYVIVVMIFRRQIT